MNSINLKHVRYDSFHVLFWKADDMIIKILFLPQNKFKAEIGVHERCWIILRTLKFRFLL